MTAMVMIQETRYAMLPLSSNEIGIRRALLQSACKQPLAETRITGRLAHLRESSPALRIARSEQEIDYRAPGARDSALSARWAARSRAQHRCARGFWESNMRFQPVLESSLAARVIMRAFARRSKC